jgi:glycolate oxidase FAD binding subunit
VPPGLQSIGHALDVRHPDPERDAFDGVLPGIVVAPRTPEGVAATLAWASSAKRSVLLRGSGSKRDWGRPPDRVDVLLELRALDRVIAHSRGDLTVSVEAGVTLADLNRRLAAHGQQLPVDPLFGDAATIGGLLATNDSGPLRHRFGTPRDLVIGIQLATPDGRLVKAGGQVVKNVAGYDLSKLVIGSFGTLAAIVAATFKLAPQPAASATVVVDGTDADALQRVLEGLGESQLEPVAFDVHARRGPDRSSHLARCLLRFASVPPAVTAAVDECQARVSAFGQQPVVIRGEEEARLWAAHAARVRSAADTILRVSWRPSDLPRALETLGTIGAHLDLALIGRVQAGAGALALGGSVAETADAIATLRGSGIIGNVVLMRAPAALKQMVDVWGAVPNANLLKALRAAVDPHGVLGANRGPL